MNKESSQTHRIEKNTVPIGMATPQNRLAAFVLDLVLIVPLVRLLQSPLRRGIMDSALLEKTVELAQYQFLNSILFFVVFIFYQALFIYWRGQTPGKIFFHIKVVSLTGPISILTALKRSFFMLVGLVLFAVPLLALFYHPLRRAIHDRISDTVVIGLKESAGFPNENEKFWAMGLTAFAFLIPFFLFISLSLIALNPSSQKDLNLFDKTYSQHLPCDYALESRSSKMEKVLELFLVDRVTQECLRDFAQESLWSHKEIELAKLAMAFSEYDKEEKSNAYLESICDESPDHHLCTFSQWLISQQSQEVRDLNNNSLQILAESKVEDFVKLILASYALKEQEFSSVEKWLGGVTRQTHLQSRISQLYLHSFLGQEKWDEAVLVYRTHLTLQEEDIVAHMVNYSPHQRWSVEKRLRILERFLPSRDSSLSRMPAAQREEESVLETYRQSLIEGL